MCILWPCLLSSVARTQIFQNTSCVSTSYRTPSSFYLSVSSHQFGSNKNYISYTLLWYKRIIVELPTWNTKTLIFHKMETDTQIQKHFKKHLLRQIIFEWRGGRRPFLTKVVFLQQPEWEWIKFYFSCRQYHLTYQTTTNLVFDSLSLKMAGPSGRAV
jgi:hypothetical protein